MVKKRQDVQLQPGERILKTDDISVVRKGIASRIGKCYLTNYRIVLTSAPTPLGVATQLSAIGSMLFGKARAMATQEESFPLRELQEIALSKYGLNKAVDLRGADGSVARMVMGAKQRQRWLAALDQVLRAQGLHRVESGEAEHWLIHPAT